ncbi:helix-turn-helix domain-containing protein [Nocardia grenadensis]
MEGKVLGERIAAARKDRNLTQDHLASRVGIERTALGRIEKGERKVSAVELVDLAAVLEIPLAWFVRDPLPAVVGRRSEAGPTHESTERLDRGLEVFAGDVASLLTTGVIKAVADRPAWPAPRSYADCEHIAGEVRERLGIGSAPMYELAGAAEIFGLYTCSLPLGGGGADRMAAARAVELLRGRLVAEDLPPRREESAADYVGL